MIRERKTNCHCCYCGRTGLKYVTEEYDTTYKTWEKTDEAIPDDWGYYGNGYLLCPKCSRNSDAHKKVKIASIKDAKKKRFEYLVILIGAIILPTVLFYFTGSIECAAITALLASLVWTISSKEIAAGCLGLPICIAIVSAVVYWWQNYVNEETNNPETTEVEKKHSPYLDGIDNISNFDELGNFYYGIADKFNKNKMGLKGTQEQIDAGNKLMVRVYDFLGTSAKNEDMLNVDSMKMIIKNFDPISDYRRKKAQEELQLGVEKIQSLNK